MRRRLALVALLACLSCDSTDEPGAGDGGGGAASGGTRGDSGGSTSGSGGRSPTGGTAGNGGSATGAVAGKGGSVTGGAPGNGGEAPLQDASVEGGSVRTDAGGDAGRDAEADASPCTGNHESPGGRYRLKLHNVITDYAGIHCASPDCQCDEYVTREEDGEAVLTLENDFMSMTTFPNGAENPPVLVPVAGLYGTFEAPLLTINNTDTHSESYGKLADGYSFSPLWFPNDGLPDPYSVSVENLTSTPPCAGHEPCGQPWDLVEVTFDTKKWTVQFKRRFHRAGLCGFDLFVAEQTGTGQRDCGDE